MKFFLFLHSNCTFLPVFNLFNFFVVCCRDTVVHHSLFFSFVFPRFESLSKYQFFVFGFPLRIALESFAYRSQVRTVALPAAISRSTWSFFFFFLMLCVRMRCHLQKTLDSFLVCFCHSLVLTAFVFLLFWRGFGFDQLVCFVSVSPAFEHSDSTLYSPLSWINSPRHPHFSILTCSRCVRLSVRWIVQPGFFDSSCQVLRMHDRTSPEVVSR